MSSTIIPNDTEPTAVGNTLVLESINRPEIDTAHNLDNAGNDVEINSPHSASFLHSEQSPSSYSIRADVAPADLFVPAWGLTTQSILSDVDAHGSSLVEEPWLILISCSGWSAISISSFLPRCTLLKMLTESQNQLVEAIRSRSTLSDDHKTLQQEHIGCAEKEATLAKKLVVSEKEKDELLDKSRAQEDRIKNSEEALASKTSSLPEVENLAATLKGDLERLTVDLSHAEIVRHNYIRQLIPTVFQWLHSSDEYNKSLSNVFNQAIAIRWSEGVKVECSAEDAEAILAAATDYDPECRSTFIYITNVGRLLMEKIAESFRLPLGDLQNMWPEGEGPTVDFVHRLSIAAWTHPGCLCVLGNVRHLAIGAWTHPGCLAFQKMFVTWPLELGLIRDVLHFGRFSSLGHWRLDSFRTSCILRDVRHLAIGAWTHLGRLMFQEMFVSWPLALGLIWGSEHLPGYKWHRHWLHESVQGS
ncbi:hypothetical protein Tco_1377329 [Tanacetum coccineum]